MEMEPTSILHFAKSNPAQYKADLEKARALVELTADRQAAYMLIPVQNYLKREPNKTDNQPFDCGYYESIPTSKMQVSRKIGLRSLVQRQIKE